MTSTILYKTRCPKCAEQGKDKHGDNLAVYSDGHSYCYSCGYITSNNSRRTSNLKKPFQEINLPLDCDWTLPPEPTKWLQKYFNYKDIPQLTFWSESRESLIFPIYDDPIKPTKLPIKNAILVTIQNALNGGGTELMIALFKLVEKQPETVVLYW